MPRRTVGSIALILVVLGTGVALGARKYSSLKAQDLAAASLQEPAESVSVGIAELKDHRSKVTSIGTVQGVLQPITASCTDGDTGCTRRHFLEKALPKRGPQSSRHIERGVEPAVPLWAGWA